MLDTFERRLIEIVKDDKSRGTTSGKTKKQVKDLVEEYAEEANE